MEAAIAEDYDGLETYHRQTPDGYDIWGRIDEQQVLALELLWKSWIAEKGCEYHPEIWVNYMRNMLQSGHYMPLVAYDGDTPVGMVEAMWTWDPFHGMKHGMGDHAYILPEHRKAGLYTEMVMALSDMADRWQTETESLPVAEDAKFLMPLYETYGFTLSGYLMRRRSP